MSVTSNTDASTWHNIQLTIPLNNLAYPIVSREDNFVIILYVCR
jgi:hypothetical protein